VVALAVGASFLYFRDARPKPEASVSVAVKDLNLAMENCFEQNKKDCYVQVAKDALEKFPYPTILQAFAQIETQPKILTRCHPVMHYLGRLEYQKTRNITQTLIRSRPTCISGSYHGAVEGYFMAQDIPLNDPDDELYTKTLTGICGQSSDYPQQEIYNQCNHGIGHALMFVTDADLPRSLKLCDALSSAVESRLCYTGVFMENSNSSTDPNHPSKYIKADNPLYPCDELGKQYESTCYALKAPYFFTSTGGDWDKTIELCGKIPQQHQGGCFSTIGANQVGFVTDSAALNDNCQRLPSKFRSSCAQGVASHLIIRYGGDYKAAMAFCAQVPLSNKQACYRQIGLSERNWTASDEELVAVCEKIKEPEYLSDCLSTN